MYGTPDMAWAQVKDLLGLLRQSLSMAVKQEGEPLPKKLKVGLGNDTGMKCPVPSCEGVLCWKPDGPNDGKFFLGCSNFRATKCKAKGCGLASKGKKIPQGEGEFLLKLVQAGARKSADRKFTRS